MLKLLLGHWRIHKKKPLLLPPEAELFAEGHNDQNPVNRINPLYEATDSDELTSVLSTNNDAKPLDPEKTNVTEKNGDSVVQDDDPIQVEEPISNNPYSNSDQSKDLQETTSSHSPIGGDDGGGECSSSSANDVKHVNTSVGETDTVNERQPTENSSEIYAERDTLENSSEEKLEIQEQPSSSGEIQGQPSSSGEIQGQPSSSGEIQGQPSSSEEIQGKPCSSGGIQRQSSSSGEVRDSTTSEDNVGDKEKLENISPETPASSDNLGKELSSDNTEVSEKSNSSTAVIDDLTSHDEEDGAVHISELVKASELTKRTLPKSNVLESSLRNNPIKNLGTDSNEDSDEARNRKRKAKYSYNWLSIASTVGKEKSPVNDSKEPVVAMGVNSEMESSHEKPATEIKMEKDSPSGILKNSLKVRARTIDELIKKFQPSSSDVKESGIGKIGKVLRKKHVFSTKDEQVKENTKSISITKKTSVTGKNPEITFPPPPPPEPSTSSASKGENDKRSKGSSEGDSGVVRNAVSSVNVIPFSSKSERAPSRPSSSFLFSDKNGETKTASSKIEEDAKITIPKKIEESKTASSSAVNHGRFKKNERSTVVKRSFETDISHPKTVSSQKDEARERKSSLASSKESEKVKVSKQSALKQSSTPDKANNSRVPSLNRVSRTDEVKSSDDPLPSKKETKAPKISSSGTEKTSKSVTSETKENQSPTRNSREWSSVKDKVEKFNGNGDVSPKSDSLIGKSQSEDSGITRGDQISSDSQISEKLREAADGSKKTKESSKPTNDNTSKLNSDVPSPKAKPRQTKERKRLQKHGHHGVACKHCKRIKHDGPKSSPLSKGNCDDYYDKVIMDGLPVHRHIRRPDSWASDMSWEEFAERDYLARLRREDRVFDKHKHLNSSFKKRLAKQRHLHRDAFHQKMHHSDEVFSHPDPYKNGFGGRHHRSHRRQSSLSDDGGSSLHFDPYYSRTPSVCSCDECWSIPHLTPQVNFGRSSVRSRASDWNYNDLCTCHIIPDLLEHRRKVKFAENHTHGPHNNDERDTDEEEEEEANSGSLRSGEHASSLSDGNSGSQTSAEGGNDDAKSSTSSVRKEKATENGNGPKGDSKVNDQYQPHPWELEEWDRLLRHRLLKKRRRRAMCMGVMALAMVVFIGLVVAIVMVYLRRKML